MSLREFAFQACSFNHSDISPFRINHLRAAREIIAHASDVMAIWSIPFLIQRFAA